FRLDMTRLRVVSRISVAKRTERKASSPCFSEEAVGGRTTGGGAHIDKAPSRCPRCTHCLGGAFGHRLMLRQPGQHARPRKQVKKFASQLLSKAGRAWGHAPCPLSLFACLPCGTC